jgi:hypothetical protein
VLTVTAPAADTAAKSTDTTANRTPTERTTRLILDAEWNAGASAVNAKSPRERVAPRCGDERRPVAHGVAARICYETMTVKESAPGLRADAHVTVL